MPLLVRACELTDWNEKQAEQYMYVVSGNGELGGGDIMDGMLIGRFLPS